MSDLAPAEKSILREYLEALLIAVVFVNFARVFVFQAFKIPTGSMVDNLLVGDHILVNKFVYGPSSSVPRFFALRDIKRGDIVVFRYPRNPRTDFVKRVIGLPGETILIKDKKVYIDGAPLREDYVIHNDSKTYRLRRDPRRLRDQFGPFRVPDGEYFVMGDNRDQSNDSRFWGTVSRELIKGRALLVYWSFDHGAPPGEAPRERVKELLSVGGHFFSRTRWNRTFLIIDSKYNYSRDAETVRTEP